MITPSRADALLALVRRELDRRPWIENEHHLGTVIFMVRFDRQGAPHKCVVKTEGESEA